LKPGLFFVMTLAAIAAEALVPGEREPSTRGSRRARAQAIRARTGWAFARCREMADRSDAEIDAIVESEKKPGPV